MADQKQRGKSKKRRAPAPPTGVGESQTKKDEVSKQAVSVKLQTKPRVDDDAKTSTADQEKSKKDEKAKTSPFGGDSESKSWESEQKKSGKAVSSAEASLKILHETEKSNGSENFVFDGSDDGKKNKMATLAEESRITFYYPKGLSPFSDESDSEASKSAAPKSPATSDTPRPPPRRKRRVKRDGKRHGGQGGGDRPTNHGRQRDDVTDKTEDSDSETKHKVDKRIHGKITEAVVKSEEKNKTLLRQGMKKTGETEDGYPEHLNPFAEDSDTEEVDPEEENTGNITEDAEQTHASIRETDSKHGPKNVDSYPEHLNPFGGDSDSGHTEEEVDSTEELNGAKGQLVHGGQPEDEGTADKRGDAGRSGEDGTRDKVRPGYPEELNPFSEDVDDDMSAGEDDGDGRSGSATVRADQEAPRKKRFGRLKRAMKSLRRLIGRFAACSRSPGEV